MRASKQNWFNTLNEALDSEELIELWELGTNIDYGQTVQIISETDKGTRLISVTRNNDGMYERPVHYLT